VPALDGLGARDWLTADAPVGFGHLAAGVEDRAGKVLVRSVSEAADANEISTGAVALSAIGRQPTKALVT
jgi:hypothetical protein